MVCVDDIGNIINPLVVAGQVHGGIAQGLGQALYEGAVYDDSGQLLTGSFMDYAVPKITQVPHFETDHTVTPCTRQSDGGSKGLVKPEQSAQRRVWSMLLWNALSPIWGEGYRNATDTESCVAGNPRCEGLI